MSEHKSEIHWSRTGDDFSYAAYSRDHTWRFDAGVEVSASASPQFKGNPACVDPEEAMVAALSSCHMLTFLAIASRKNLVVNEYRDAAVGWLEKNAEGKFALTRVTLRPDVIFEGARPPAGILHELHEAAHNECFLANSVRTRIEIEPR